MKVISFPILLLCLIFVLGCRTTTLPPESFHVLFQENATDARAYLEPYKHILLACIYEDDWQDRGPGKYSMYRFKATVVQSYKGDWLASERISCVHGIYSPVGPNFKSNDGELVFLFTNEHTDAEIGFEAGTFHYYTPQLARVIEYLFP